MIYKYKLRGLNAKTENRNVPFVPRTICTIKVVLFYNIAPLLIYVRKAS